MQTATDQVQVSKFYHFHIIFLRNKQEADKLKAPEKSLKKKLHLLPDLLRDLQKILGAETGEKPVKGASSTLCSLC